MRAKSDQIKRCVPRKKYPTYLRSSYQTVESRTRDVS